MLDHHHQSRCNKKSMDPPPSPTRYHEKEHGVNHFDVCVVGGGVVGCAILRALAGYRVVLLERHEALLQEASGANSGIVCTGVDAPPHSLERALIRDSISHMRPYLQHMNVPHRDCGSLVCQWKAEEDKEEPVEQTTADAASEASLLNHVLQESHDAGDTQATLVSRSDFFQKEPHVNPEALEHGSNNDNDNDDNPHVAVHIPGEVVVDPWLYEISLVVQARQHGAQVYTNFDVDPQTLEWDAIATEWILRRQRRRNNNQNDDDEALPLSIRAKVVINATGLWADEFQHAAFSSSSSSFGDNGDHDNLHKHGRPHWKAQPRRGQYRVYRAKPNATSIEHPLQPIPTSRTKGVFVFGTVHQDLVVIGPTALDQDSKTDRIVDPQVAQQLQDRLSHVVPQLDPDRDFVGDYVGLRPGVQDARDYQFRVYPAAQWIATAGVRSTGLTASLGIGRHVRHLVQSCLHHVLPATNPPIRTISIKPLPPVRELVADFGRRGDGTVEIHGHVYQVTHPLTKWSWQQQWEAVKNTN